MCFLLATTIIADDVVDAAVAIVEVTFLFRDFHLFSNGPFVTWLSLLYLFATSLPLTLPYCILCDEERDDCKTNKCNFLITSHTQKRYLTYRIESITSISSPKYYRSACITFKSRFTKQSSDVWACDMEILTGYQLFKNKNRFFSPAHLFFFDNDDEPIR